MELYKQLPIAQKQHLLKLLNGWWIEEILPDSITDAQVVLIFKKGDTNLFENYRPISLLNSIYKVFAALIKLRLEEEVDSRLQKMQFGFRRNRSTSQALAVVRRISDYGERTGDPIYLLLLDWRMAFDK
eukprot:8994333-Prorocentrum_lima.AAC.1